MLIMVAGLLYFVQHEPWAIIKHSLVLAALGVYPILWLAYYQIDKLKRKIEAKDEKKPN